VFRFDDSPSLARALRENDQEFLLPEGERVGDGEWVLAIFEVGRDGLATAAAARGMHREAGAAAVLAFERRDWDPLVDFAEEGSAKMRVAKAPPATPTQKSLLKREGDAGADSEREPSDSEREPVGMGGAMPSFAHWRANDPLAKGPHARVLLVDDDRDIRDVVGAMLDAVGLTVEATTSAEEALERVRREAFDLVVLDWNLPGMTGVELCRHIRRDPALATLPVLFLTAHASSRDVVEAFACGADDYVVKPFRAPELGARIFGLLRRARMAPAAP